MGCPLEFLGPFVKAFALEIESRAEYPIALKHNLSKGTRASAGLAGNWNWYGEEEKELNREPENRVKRAKHVKNTWGSLHCYL